MMWDGFNQRKFPRINIRCEITIQAKASRQPITTMTENLGLGGVCVILRERLERFAACQLRLELPESGSWIASNGKIVWTVPTRNSKTRTPQFDTGIEFVAIDSDAKDKIRKFLTSLESSKPA